MKDFEETLLKVTLHNITTAISKQNSIDYKAIAIITISGVLISFLARLSSSNGKVATFFFILTLFSFFEAIWLSVAVLEPRNTYELSTLNFISDLDDENDERQVCGIIGTSAEIEDELQDICNEKANKLWNAIRGLQVSIVFMSLYSATAFLGL
ncbi:TPA: hypothetical protein HA351_05740 [Methanosarcinaceae archaeon]|nr:hypothetical protein [Methanosarcinaceae archaeon]